MTTDPDRSSLNQLRHQHTPQAIEHRLKAGPRYSYLRDFIYGAIDGAVTTFAVVAGVAGANLSAGIVVILGVANLVADGFSMAVSNYLGTRADEQRRLRLRRQEEAHIEQFPAGEREEIRQIFAAKGFEGDDLERVVDVITSDRDRWVNTMLTDELGEPLSGPNAWRAAASTFVAFVSIGVLPLLAYLYQITGLGGEVMNNAFLYSALMTGVAFFVVGAMKSRFVDERWWVAGSATLLIGGMAAVLAYTVGASLKELVPMT